MSTAREIARRYLIEEYLMREPEYIDFVEWLDEERDTIVTDEDDSDLHDAVIDLLEIVAQRLDDEEN